MGVGVGATKTFLTHPDSKGLPDSVSLPPPTSPLGWCGEGGSEGGDGQLTLGHWVPHSHQEGTVPRENVSTKGHMAPFCMRPLDKGVGWGAEKLPEGTLLEGTGPTPLRQQAGCLRGRMGNFSCWLGSCDARPEEGFIATACSSACSHFLFCP